MTIAGNGIASFLPEAELRALADEIAARGFEADPLVSGHWTPCWGLNVAVGWPLPIDGGVYERFAAELALLDPGLFVYPHAQTHVTVLTLVSFKEHRAPTDLGAFEALSALVAARLPRIVGALRPFTLELGPPVLSRGAAFIPIRDEAQAIARLRAQLMPALRDLDALRGALVPRAVHTTVARFHTAPGDPSAFAARFADWARARALGPAGIRSILLTTETRPYMREGRIVAEVAL